MMDKLWAVVVKDDPDGEVTEWLLAQPETYQKGGSAPIWNGSLASFAAAWKGCFRVVPVPGHYIEIKASDR